MSRKSAIMIFIGVGIIIIILLSLSLVSKALSNESHQTNAPQAFVNDPYKDIIKRFQDALQTPGPSNASRRSMETQVFIMERDATRLAEGFTNPPPTRRATVAPVQLTGTVSNTDPDGISNTPGSPLPLGTVTVLNSWRKTTPDRYYLVYAGYLTKDQQQGVVFVLHPGTHNFVQYNTPGKSGGVMVVQENGTRITLQSTGGVLYYFDAQAEQFLNEEGTPFPTETPIPSNTQSPALTPGANPYPNP